MINGYRLSQLIYVAARLGIADLLAAGPKQTYELAAATDTHPDSLRRILRALASFDVFSEVQEEVFQLTPLAACLQKGAPGSLWAFAVSIGEPWWWRPWGELLHSVQTGEVAFDHIYGEGIFEYLKRGDQASAIFNENMRAMTESEAQGIIAAYDFSHSRIIADIGGGTGALLFTILGSQHESRGILFDDASVIAEAQSRCGDTEVGRRCSFVPGNFFASVSVKADLYLLKDVLHDWDDQHAIAILHNLRKAMTSHSKLLVIERLIAADDRFSISKELDIVMLVFTGGKERTREQYSDLLASAGFTVRRVVDAGMATSIIEASPS